MDLNKLLKKLENKLKKFVNKLLAKYIAEPTEESDSPTTPTQPSNSDDEINFSKLNFCWGGFNGTKAQLDANARISNLKITSSGMSYQWKSGGCENLNTKCSHSNPCCTCALFCLIDGKWLGGKWEHISTDRTTRGFENIIKGYGGWDSNALNKANSYAFVIFDDGAKKRTNVITYSR